MSDIEDAPIKGVSGIIVPPPDKRTICDKTAQFVARNGPSFMKKIRETDPTGRKFSFLNTDDLYNSYFLQKVKDFQAANAMKSEAAATQAQTEADAGLAAAPAPEPAAPAPEAVKPKKEKKQTHVETVTKDAIITIVAKASKGVPEGPPPPQLFSLTHPGNNESAMQIDIIKHTAQFTAVSGRAFLTGLAAREHRNPQFDFLKHTHAYFGYFTGLVESYSKIIAQDNEVLTRLKAGALSEDHILRRVIHRWQHHRKAEDARHAKEKEEADRLAYQSIDWHDFMVVETITFPEEEALPASAAAALNQVTETTDGGDMDMDMDMDEDEGGDMDMDEGEDEPAAPLNLPADSGIKVREDYVPQVEGQKVKAIKNFIDPKTGRQVPVEEASEHMRIELMDPKWREQQQRRREKQRESGFAQDENIASHLSRFAKRRTDIFGGEESKEDQVAAPGVIWDGVNADPEIRQKLTLEAARAQMLREQMEAANAKPKTIDGPTLPRQMQQQQEQQQQQPPAGVTGSAGAGPMGTPSMLPPGPMGMAALMGGMPAGLPPGMGMPGGIPTGMMQPPVAPYGSLQTRPAVDASMQPQAKRQRVAAPEPTEEEWLAQHPGPQTVNVVTPNDDSNPEWNLNGQTVSLLVPLSSPVAAVKAALQAKLGGMPTNKMQIKSDMHGFLKDNKSLSSYRVAPGESLTLQTRTRGRRR